MNAKLRSSRRWCGLLVLCAVAGCGKGSASNSADTSTPQKAAAPSAAAPAAESTPTVRGTVASVSDTQLVVKTDSASVTVKLAQPVRSEERRVGKECRSRGTRDPS